MRLGGNRDYYTNSLNQDVRPVCGIEKGLPPTFATKLLTQPWKILASQILLEPTRRLAKRSVRTLPEPL